MKRSKLFLTALTLLSLLLTAGCGSSGGGSGGGTPAPTTSTVTGTLSNSVNAQILSGITVIVSATNQSATTDAAGSFSIANVPIGSQNLIFSQDGGLVGSMTITVGGATCALGPVKVVVIGSSQPGAPPLPTISPNGAIFTSSQTVTMADAQSGTRIAYTSDGSDPRVSGTTRTYSGPLTVSGTTTLNAAAEGSASIFSAVTSATFTLTSGGTGTGGSGTGTGGGHRRHRHRRHRHRRHRHRRGRNRKCHRLHRNGKLSGWHFAVNYDYRLSSFGCFCGILVSDIYLSHCYTGIDLPLPGLHY